MPKVDPSARGSDIPRSRRQYWARRFGAALVAALGLNRPGFLTTEFVQQIKPVCKIPTPFGPMFCRGGHGRLSWRAKTFYTEEPETITWLESISSDDVLWDIGANVGLYSIYAAKAVGCRVVAIEPEAQNYALLLDNIVLNGVQEDLTAINVAMTSASGMGSLMVHGVTKGGAWNQFSLFTHGNGPTGSDRGEGAVSQVQFGASPDDLVNQFHLPSPTYIKIDVDGIEADIIDGASRILGHGCCKSLLIEIKKDDPEHMRMIERLAELGYRSVSETSDWGSQSRWAKEPDRMYTNMIFERDANSAEVQRT